jgi:hypothetical protein
MLSPKPNNRATAYRGFINIEDSADIFDIFYKPKLPMILGTDNFKDWVKASFFVD